MAEIDPWATYERLTAANRESLTSSHRELLALGGLRTELNNGGFHQYFFNSAGDSVLDALAAADRAEAEELSSLVRRAVEILSTPDPRDREARQEALDLLDDDAFEELDSAYLALELATDLDGVMRAVGSCPIFRRLPAEYGAVGVEPATAIGAREGTLCAARTVLLTYRC